MLAPPRPNSLEAIGGRLRLIRIAYGRVNGHQDELSQKDFAETCGISRQMWNNAEKARARLGLDHALKVWKRTGASLEYIYEGDTKFLPLALAREIETIVASERPVVKRA